MPSPGDCISFQLMIQMFWHGYLQPFTLSTVTQKFRQQIAKLL